MSCTASKNHVAANHDSPQQGLLGVKPTESNARPRMLSLSVSSDQCFKTWTGPAGRPGTRPTRAWDRSGWRQKPARELTWQNPIDPEGRPGTRSTRSNPGETRSIFGLEKQKHKRTRQINHHYQLRSCC